MPENVHIFAMNLGELETEVLRKLWISTSEDSNGFSPDTAFVKYSKYRIRKKINQVYSETVAFARAHKSWFIVTLSSGYHQYGVPQNCFDIASVYYFSSATTYTKLTVYDEEIIESLLSPGWKTIPGVPQYAYTGDRSKMVVKLGIAPPPNTSGTAITLASGVYSKSAPHGTLEAVSGSAAPTSGTNVYVDSSGQDFSDLGVIVGLIVLNISDGSRGTITSITTTNTANDTINCSGNLSGGLNNIWTPGDEMRVIGGEYGGFIQVGDTEASYILASTIGQVPKPGITMAAGNLLIQGYFYPILLRDKYQYPELPPVFHSHLALGAASLLGREEPADSPEFAQALKYEDEFNKSIGLLTGFVATQYKGEFNLWSRKS